MWRPSPPLRRALGLLLPACLALAPPPSATLDVAAASASFSTFAEPAGFGAFLPVGPGAAPARALALASASAIGGIGADPLNFACGPLPPAPTLPAGTTLLASRGNCSFVRKAAFAAAAGAQALLVYNGLAGLYANANASGAGGSWLAVGECDSDCAQSSALVSAADAASLPLAYAGFPTSPCSGTCASRLCALTAQAPAADGSRQVCCVPNDLIAMGGFVSDGSLDRLDVAFVSAGDGARLVALLLSGDQQASGSATARLALRPVPFMDTGSVLLWLLGSIAAALASWVSAQDERDLYLDRLEGLDDLGPDDDAEDEDVESSLTSRDPEAVAARRRRRSGRRERRARRAARPQQPPLSLTPRQAVYLLLYSCVLLVGLYFLVQVGALLVVYVIMAVFAVGAVSALAQIVFLPLIEKWLPSLERRTICVLPWGGGPVVASSAAAQAAAAAVVLNWLITRNAPWAFALQDILGVALCCHFLVQLRLATLRTCALTLSAFFLYDIVMVFITPYIFGASVMIAVATAGLPVEVANMACYCRLHPGDASVCGAGESMPILLRLPRIDDYRGGYSMLGLGDVVLPGLLLSFALRQDYALQRGAAARAGSDAGLEPPAAEQQRGTPSGFLGVGLSGLRSVAALLTKQGVVLGGYWPIALAGYAVGLMMANFAVASFQQGQPALLYLVPMTVLPVALVASSRGELDALWRGRGVGDGVGLGASGEAVGEGGVLGGADAGGDESRRDSLRAGDSLAAPPADTPTMVDMPPRTL